jgi:reactive intermediate/imine deaminase
MARDARQPEGVVRPKAPYSPVVVSHDLVLLSGQVPFDADGNIVSDDAEDQVRQVFENVGRCLAAAGCGFEDVIKVTTFLADLSDFAVYNEIYSEYFRPPYPARTTVGAALIGIKIEVEAIARRPSSR